MLTGRCVILHGLAGATLIALALFLTNPYFSMLEDETSIIVAANAPISQTLRLFVTGEGQHEHPPLSDLLLHFWLPVAGTNPSLVRLPSIILYAIALVVFAGAARNLSGTTAFYATLGFGMLWPFGFHFGRLAGWYSFCFLLVGLLTLAYLHFLDAPSWGRWLLVVVISFAALISKLFLLACCCCHYPRHPPVARASTRFSLWGYRISNSVCGLWACLDQFCARSATCRSRECWSWDSGYSLKCRLQFVRSIRKRIGRALVLGNEYSGGNCDCHCAHQHGLFD